MRGAARATWRMASILAVGLLSHAFAHVIGKANEVAQPTGGSFGGGGSGAFWPVVVAFVHTIDATRKLFSGKGRQSGWGDFARGSVTHCPVGKIANIVEQCSFDSELGDREAPKEILVGRPVCYPLELVMQFWLFLTIEPPAPSFVVQVAFDLHISSALVDSGEREGCGRAGGRMDAQVEHGCAFCAH